jgi:hypothetical protein
MEVEPPLPPRRRSCDCCGGARRPETGWCAPLWLRSGEDAAAGVLA